MIRTAFQDIGERMAADGYQTGGGTDVFEDVARCQFIKLIECGLLPESYLLDVGCGSLRGGYWSIHFLRPDHYFGIEPNPKMREGQKYLLSESLAREKRPVFSDNADFNFSVFGQSFDFVMARSIWTHASRRQIEHMLDQFILCGNPGARFITSYTRAHRAEAEYKGDEFTWRVIRYLRETLFDLIGQRGLSVEEQETIALQTWLVIRKPTTP